MLAFQGAPTVGAMGEVTRLANFSDILRCTQKTLAIKKKDEIMLYHFPLSFKFQQLLRNHVQIYFSHVSF